MKLYRIIFFSFASCFSCQSQEKLQPTERQIVLDNIAGDSILMFYGKNKDTLGIFRRIDVIENKNTDTVAIGYSLVPPGFTGNLFFIQDGLDSSSAFYIDRVRGLNTSNETHYAKLFSIGVWGKNSGKRLRHIKIGVLLKQLDDVKGHH